MVSALGSLAGDIGSSVGAAVSGAIGQYLPHLQHGTGPAGTRGGLAVLHRGEIVATPQESAGIRSGEGYYGAGGYQTYDMTGEPRGNGGSGDMSASVNVVVNVAGHATRDDADYIAQVIGKKLRSGDLRVMVERIQKGTL